MFRTEQIRSTMTCGVTDQVRVNNETASANSQTEKVRGKPYSLHSRDLHVGAKAAEA
jgi:hypothetical protein